MDKKINVVKKGGEVFISISDLVKYLQAADVTPGSYTARAIDTIVNRLTGWAKEA